MRNRWLVNLLLLILVIGLGAMVRWELERERWVATLTGLLPERITEISIEQPKQPPIRLEQGADGWRMEAPYRMNANAQKIEELVNIAVTPVYRSLPPSTPSEGLGLSAASLRLTLNGLVLRFGAIDPIGQHRYVAIGNQVHLIGDGFYHHLIARAEDYVDRALLPPGFQAATGSLGGAPLAGEQLSELNGLVAEVVEPLGSELIGRLLALRSEDTNESLRFLISGDGLGWARLDLRLRYLLASPPPWAVAEAALAPDRGGSETNDLNL